MKRNLIIIVPLFGMLMLVTFGGWWLVLAHLIAGVNAFISITLSDSFQDKWSPKWTLAKTGLLTVLMLFGFVALAIVLVTDSARDEKCKY